ncbi:MAG TPA: hypothetical protein VHO43_13310, partial [Ignavibacteriales bacterium]|nr:hypothetical protein [Ignavibacteriales bacterium]
MSNKALKIFICILILISSTQAQVKNKSQIHNRGNRTVTKISSDNDYQKLWEKVDELEKSGLTKSAKEKAEEIYRKAEKVNNQQQMIKSFLVTYSLRSAVEEDIDTVVIKELKERISQAKAP